MDLLDLFLLLFSRAAPGERGDGGVHRRQFLGTFSGEPRVSAGRLCIFTVHSRRFEYRWAERREMAAERRRCDDLYSLAAAGRGRRGGLAEVRARDALYVGEHDASVELGNGEFLAADSLCICGTGVGFRDERRNS